MPSSSDPADQLSGLFSAIFAYVRDNLRGRVEVEDILRAARTVLDNLRVEDGSVAWDTALPLTVGQARWREHVGRGVRIVGHVAELHVPGLAIIPTPRGDVDEVETTAVKISGIDGEQLYMLDVISRPLIEKVQEAQRVGALCEFLGVIVALPVHIDPSHPDRRSVALNFFCHLIDARPTTSALDLLGASDAERAAVAELLEDLIDRGVSPLDHVKELTLSNLGVVARDQAPHMMVGVEFAVLQAMSCGRVGNGPARLHGLVVGPPGLGKKLIGQAARAANPVAQEASAAKVSAAGLVGASYQTGSGWSSRPGLVPRASQGVLVVQDAHGWNKHKVNQIAPILQELMEDGEVRDSVAGGRTRVAETALLIDLNRHAHVHLSVEGGAEAPLLTILPLLSRFDFILEIATDPTMAWAVGQRMYASMGQGRGPLEQQDWVRQCRLLVGLLRDRHPVVDTGGVLSTLEAVHDRFAFELEDVISQRPVEASAIPARLSVSMTRFVIASARGDGRSYATEADVERATRFMRIKLDFIRAALLSHVPLSGCPTDPPAARDRFYRDFWTGKAARPADVAAEYARRTGERVSVKTVRRDYKRLGATKGEVAGTWVLPASPTPPSQGQRDIGTKGQTDEGEADGDDDGAASDEPAPHWTDQLADTVRVADVIDLDRIIEEECGLSPSDLAPPE